MFDENESNPEENLDPLAAEHVPHLVSRIIAINIVITINMIITMAIMITLNVIPVQSNPATNARDQEPPGAAAPPASPAPGRHHHHQ